MRGFGLRRGFGGKLTDEEIAVGIELDRIFAPSAHSKREKIRTEGGRFVHYTSAENAVKIITSRRVWMRNVQCMNDYSEAVYGHRKLVDLFQKPPLKDAYLRALAPFGENMGETILNQFDQWWGNIQFNTYICSISEHAEAEDFHGRLSMWRAYGGSTAKAALILRLPLTPGAVVGLPLFLSPVEYLTDAQIESDFLASIRSIEQNVSYLKEVDPQRIWNAGFFALVLTALCLKHEGFKEEREWRIIHLPHAIPSGHIEQGVEVIGGVPQTVFKIRLENKPEEQISGIGISEMIDRIIIGPSVYPVPIYQAFTSLLAEAGVTDAASRVATSFIPLRT